MNSVIYIALSLFCAVTIVTKEISKTQWIDGDKWIWGYFDESVPSDDVPQIHGRLLDVNATRSRLGEVSGSSTETTTTSTTQTPSTTAIPATTIETTTAATTIVTTTAATTIVTTTAATTTKATTSTTTKPIYCEYSYVPPKMPDYSLPGRRTNEAKCLEYVWQFNDRIRQKDQANECIKYQKRSRKRGRSGGHVAGGRKTKPVEFPHMGAVGWKAAVGTWVFKCGSSLISKKFVLTAAHCTAATPTDSTIADPVPKIIRLGDKNIIDRIAYNSPPKIDADISRIIVHPKYKSPMKYHDIALMELEGEVEFTKFIQPACLWNKFEINELGKQATLTGWGVIESGSLEISPELQAATVDLLESEQCDQLLERSHNRNWDGFHDDQICAGKLAGGVDSCQGDSGGPLQLKMPLPQQDTEREGSMHYVIGVISFGVGCAHPNLPGIYTRVSTFVDWIEENVWSNESQIIDQ